MDATKKKERGPELKASSVLTPEMQLVSDGMVDVNEAAAFLGFGRTKTYEAMDAGELPFVKYKRSRRIPRRGLLEFAARHLQGALNGGK